MHKIWQHLNSYITHCTVFDSTWVIYFEGVDHFSKDGPKLSKNSVQGTNFGLGPLDQNSGPKFLWQYHVVTIWGRLDFEGNVYRDWHTCTYTASIMSIFVCTYNVHAHTHIVVDLVPCGEILRAVFIGMGWMKYVARFQRWRDFEEIQYYSTQTVI